ncbi:MAG: radical SAM protein, partial [Candidatus Omnitrophica bacterium]|nr:radical SAM protein [Candidatus Omnitrophota bacterium]
DEIHKQGCFWLTISGGDPLVREDFLEIYSYAKDKGFIITLFTNAYGLTPKIINSLIKSPFYSIEITLNGITKEVYEAVTGVEGSFPKVIKNIKRLKQEGFPLILKTNCLKTNKHQLGKIKRWAEKLLGKPKKDRHYFKYDPMIYPRLNGDKTPCEYRLSFEELVKAKKQDADIWKEYKRGLHGKLPKSKRTKDFLYRCNSWMNQFFVNPYGKLKFCEFSEKFSIDLKTTPFNQGFYRFPYKVLNEKYKTNSKCRTCKLRPICYHCPARTYLETSSEEEPVSYYCELAKALRKRLRPPKPKDKKLPKKS